VRWIRLLLKSLAAEGRTVFVSSHLMNEMAQTATRLVVLGRGRLISETSVEDFTSHAAAGVLVRTLSGITAEQIGTAAWRAHLPCTSSPPRTRRSRRPSCKSPGTASSTTPERRPLGQPAEPRECAEPMDRIRGPMWLCDRPDHRGGLAAAPPRRLSTGKNAGDWLPSVRGTGLAHLDEMTVGSLPDVPGDWRNKQE